jgi:hypothetical protein
MQTSDWAQEAHAWFSTNRNAILNGTQNEYLGGDGLVPIDLSCHPLLQSIDLVANWRADKFSLQEQVAACLRIVALTANKTMLECIPWSAVTWQNFWINVAMMGCLTSRH